MACRGWLSSFVSPTCALSTHHRHPLVLRVLQRMIHRRCAGGCFAAPASLIWRMLHRPCYFYSDGCFAVMVATCRSSSTDALPSWCYYGGCLTALMLLQGLSHRLGGGALCVGSDAICRLVWLGELSGPLPPFCSCCLASLQAICFPGLFYFFLF